VAGNGNGKRLLGCDLVTRLGLGDPASVREDSHDVAEGGCSDPASLPQVFDGQRRAGFSEDVLHSLLGRLRRWRRDMTLAIDDLEGYTVVAGGQAQGKVGDRGRSTMFDGEGGRLTLAPQVEVGVTPGVKLRGAAQRLCTISLIDGHMPFYGHVGRWSKVFVPHISWPSSEGGNALHFRLSAKVQVNGIGSRLAKRRP